MSKKLPRYTYHRYAYQRYAYQMYTYQRYTYQRYTYLRNLRNFKEPQDSSKSVNDPILSEVISVLRSSVRSHATHAIGELKNKIASKVPTYLHTFALSICWLKICFLTAILHCGLRYYFFFILRFIYTFQFIFGHLYSFSIWNFVFLFFFELFFCFPFGLFFSFLFGIFYLFYFNSFSIESRSFFKSLLINRCL